MKRLAKIFLAIILILAAMVSCSGGKENSISGELQVSDPALVATALVGGLTQASSMQVLRGRELDARAVGDALIPIFLKGLTAPTPPEPVSGGASLPSPRT